MIIISVNVSASSKSDTSVWRFATPSANAKCVRV